MSYTNGLDKPSDYFNTLLYTADQQANRVISGVGFQPDWVWLKNRNQAVTHDLYDAVRGATKALHSNSNSAETNQPDGLIAFNSDGFTVDTSWGNYATGNGYVSWNWLGGNGTASNSNGSITSTISANATAGFSIVKWTGSGSSATLGHGLGATPKLIIVKNRTDTVNWFLYNHSVITPSSTNKIFMTLNDSRAIESNGTATTFTSVSDTTFGVGTDNIINGSSDNMIAYVFAEKQGYSKFDKFIGNGNADGTFIYTGFKPAWIVMKASSTTGNWGMFDNKRIGYNVKNYNLRADQTNTEGTDDAIDILSNGFKIRSTSGGFGGGSGTTYIYMAFAENPFVTSTGIPSLAR